MEGSSAARRRAARSRAPGRERCAPFQHGVLAGAAVAWVTLGGAARADPVSLTTVYSPYETAAIVDAESSLGTTIDPLPEGKTIERIDFVRVDPIDRHDVFPLATNRLHTTTRPSVLRHEMIVGVGDPWRKVAVDESARILRLLPQVSLVLCVPMRGSAAERVRLVVITKDVWSLYVDFDVDGTPGGLELLKLEPKETNVAGLLHTALARFILQPKSYTLGASYDVPRLDGRWLDLFVEGNVMVDRATGVAEGTYGSARIARPLYSSRTEWAWSSEVTWTNELDRRYVNAAVDAFTPRSPSATLVPWVWRERTISEQVKVTRSFGWEAKNDLSLGASLSRAEYVVPVAPTLDPAAVSQFERAAVPVGEARVGPFVQWHGYRSDFVRILDFDTLALQEDYRLGHEVWLRAYPVARALGSTRDLLGTYAAAAYTFALGDGLATISVSSTTEAEAHAISDAALQAGFGVVTPRLGVGRLVFTAIALNRWRNHLNVQSFLGGDTLLRGYPSRYLAGKDLVASNLEFRSRPVEIASFQFGAAAFYDAGDAFYGFDHLDPKHAVGVGLRAVFPQIERPVLRLDVAFPVSATPLRPEVSPVSFFVSFGQAVNLPVIGAGLAP